MTISEGARKCIAALLNDTMLRRATFYVTSTLTIKATRQHRTKRGRSATFVVSMGRPNFRERAYIHNLRAAGCLFPVRKLQFDFWPENEVK
jgi:hypothetical protein